MKKVFLSTTETLTILNVFNENILRLEGRGVAYALEFLKATNAYMGRIPSRNGLENVLKRENMAMAERIIKPRRNPVRKIDTAPMADGFNQAEENKMCDLLSRIDKKLDTLISLWSPHQK